MNLLFDARVFEMPFSGVAKATLYLFKACNDYFPGVLNFYGLYTKKIYTQMPDFINLVQYPIGFNKYSCKNIQKIAKKVNASACYFPWNGDIPKGDLNIKKIITIHDLLPLEIPNYFSSSEQMENYINGKKRDASEADIIFTDSDYSKNKIMEILSPKNEPIVLSFGSTLEINEVPVTETKEIPYFVYVGGYHIRKGIKHLLKAILLLAENSAPEFMVKIVGQKSVLDNETVALLKLCREKNLIQEVGYVAEKDLYNLYNKSLGLVYLSKYEGFGLPPLEAMSAGCPVITTRYTSIPEICGDAALYVEPENTVEVSETMKLLYSDNEKRKSFIENGRKQASQFSWQKAAEVFIKEVTK